MVTKEWALIAEQLKAGKNLDDILKELGIEGKGVAVNKPSPRRLISENQRKAIWQNKYSPRTR